MEITPFKKTLSLKSQHYSSQLLDDTVGSVRDAAAGALGTAMKVVGEKFMSEYINDLDNIKKQKVNQLVLWGFFFFLSRF